MEIIIRAYDASLDYKKLTKVIENEGDEWEDYLLPKYQEILEKSITYVAYFEDEICGYARSISDFGLYTFVVDLLVDKKYRGNSIGKQLLEFVSKNYPAQDIFVLSDVDEYYRKLGYSVEGTIFNVK